MTVVEFQHVKPGKGGAFVRTKLKKVARRRGARAHVPRRREGAARDHRQARDAVPLPRGQRARVHGQRDLRPDQRRDRRSSAARSTTSRRATPRSCTCTTARSSASSCPPRSSSPSAETEPGVQGDRVSGARKPATLETGLVVQVPLFVETGREDQGRHPHRGVPGARLSVPMAVTWQPPRSTGAGARPLLRARGARPRRRRPARAAAGAARRVRGAARARRRGAPRRARRAAPQVLRALGARAHARGRPRRPPPRLPTSSAGSPRSRPRS